MQALSWDRRDEEGYDRAAPLRKSPQPGSSTQPPMNPMQQDRKESFHLAQPHATGCGTKQDPGTHRHKNGPCPADAQS